MKYNYVEYYGYKFYSSKEYTDADVFEFIEIPLDHPYVGKDINFIYKHLCIHSMNKAGLIVHNDDYNEQNLLVKSDDLFINNNENVFYTYRYYLRSPIFNRIVVFRFFLENDGKTKNIDDVINKCESWTSKNNIF